MTITHLDCKAKGYPISPRPHFFNAAFTAGTSSSNGRMSGSGPSGVRDSGLIWRCDLV